MSVEASLRIAAVQMDANPAPTIDRLEPSMSVPGFT